MQSGRQRVGRHAELVKLLAEYLTRRDRAHLVPSHCFASKPRCLRIYASNISLVVLVK